MTAVRRLQASEFPQKTIFEPFVCTSNEYSLDRRFDSVLVGYACKLKNVVRLQKSPSGKRLGCCDISAAGTKRFSCDSCEPSSSCCSSYSLCVSCCMSPASLPAVRRGAEKAMALRALRTANDLYEVCRASCRTNSKSVEHENAYKHRRHHCFGQNPAPVGSRGGSPLFNFVRPFRRS